MDTPPRRTPSMPIIVGILAVAGLAAYQGNRLEALLALMVGVFAVLFAAFDRWNES